MVIVVILNKKLLVNFNNSGNKLLSAILENHFCPASTWPMLTSKRELQIFRLRFSTDIKLSHCTGKLLVILLRILVLCFGLDNFFLVNVHLLHL